MICVVTADHRYLSPHELLDGASGRLAVPRGLSYPLRVVFSTHRRPRCFRGRIEFDDVHFAYPTDLRRPVLQGITFTVEPGEKVALVGPTGCGRSSMCTTCALAWLSSTSILCFSRRQSRRISRTVLSAASPTTRLSKPALRRRHGNSSKRSRMGY